MGRVLVSAAAFALLLGVASAQSREAFKEVEGFVDVYWETNGNTTTVTLGENPQVFYNGEYHDIKEIYGFYYLSNDNDLIGKAQATGDWRVRSNNAGVGGVFGFFTQPKNGLEAGGSYSFTVTDLNFEDVDQIGFTLHANGVPAHVTLQSQPVPEPTTLAGLGLGAVALLRRRRKK